MKNFCFVKFWIPPFSDFHMTPLVGISQSVWEFHEMRRDAVLQMFGPLRMPQPPFLKHILPQTFWNDSVTWNTSRKGHPVWGTTYVDITTIHFKLKCSLGLWQLPWERWWWFAFWERGSCYTGEKVIKTSAKENTFIIQLQAEEESKESDTDSCRVISWTAFMCCAGIIPWMFL